MRLRAALIGSSPGWEQLLLQEGFSFAVADLEREDLSQEYSLVIVHRPLTGKETGIVREYVARGGAVLGDASVGCVVAGMEAREEFIEYLVGDGSPPFRSLALADIGLPGSIAVEAITVRTQQNSFAVFAGPVGRGWGVLLPFAAGLGVMDGRSHPKSFYAPFDRLPSENVSTVAKGEIRHLVRDALVYLHACRGIPYAHLWYFPGDARNVFAFRVDSDAAPRSTIDRLYDLSRRHDVPLTWFLDVKSHESWIQHFAAMTGQEFGVHCYDHRVSGDSAANVENFGKAKAVMEAVGFQPEGFAAPFGYWNRVLADVTKELGFRYSSEFACAYDTLPFRPPSTRGIGVLQIPIHPICPGSLRRAGCPDRKMLEYFSLVASWKAARREPLFFYHHPSHESWETVESILSLAALPGVRPVTFGGYQRWWERRGGIRPDLRIERGWLTADRIAGGLLAESDVMVRVVMPDGREAVVSPGERLDLELLRWEDPPVFSPPADLRRIREFDPRRVLGDLYDSMLRRMR